MPVEQDNKVQQSMLDMETDKSLPPVKKTRTRTEPKYFLVVLPVVLYYFCTGLCFYAASEWIQHRIKLNVFPNGSFNLTSDCGAFNKSDPEYILHSKVQSETSTWFLYMSLATSVPALVSSSLLPTYSDTFGRKFLFITGNVGFLIKCVIITIAVGLDLSPVLAVVAFIIDGVCGSFNVLQSAVYSYIADCTVDGKSRTVAIAAIDGIEKFCMTACVLTAGYFIKYQGFFVPMCTSTGLAAVILLLHIFVVPESYPKAIRTKTLSIPANLRRTVDFYTSDSFKGQRCTYILLLAAYMTSELTSAHRTSLELLFQLGRPFCWTSEKIGIFGALRQATQGIAAMVLVKPLKIFLSELKIALMSTLFKIGSYVLEGLARTDLMLYMVPVLASFSNLGVSMAKSMLSLKTPSDKQGSLFASIYIVFGITSICAPYLGNTVYSASVSTMSGLVFLVIAAVSGLPLTLLIIYWMTQSDERRCGGQKKSINYSDEK